MGDDDATLIRRAFEKLAIRSANQPFVPSGSQVTAAHPKACDNVWSDVLVRKERKVERLHAVMLSSQVRSPLSTSAAYPNAAASPSGVS